MKTTLQQARRDWKKLTHGMDAEKLTLFMGTFCGKAFLFRNTGIYEIILIEDEFFDPENDITKAKFIFQSAITKDDCNKVVPPWYVLAFAETEVKEISEDETKTTERCYQLIWNHWNEYINTQEEVTNEEVDNAKQEITNEHCPYYPNSVGGKIWESALDDMARKMHSSYIPRNTRGKALWSQNDA